MDCRSSGDTTRGVKHLTRKTIAVEPPLSPVVDTLKQAGYHVVSLDDDAWRTAQAIVVQGMDDHFLGMQDPETHAPVIDADGMTPDQVLAEVNRRAL